MGASLLSHEFEIVMFEGSNPLRYAFYMMGVAVKQVQKMPGVHTVRSTRIELVGDAPIQVDGEYVGRSPATIEIVRDALTLLVPPTYG
jgi:diacylglycerol kinase family enzyme